MSLRVPPESQIRLLDVLALDTEDLMISRTVSDAENELVALDNDAEYQRLVRECEEWADRFDDVDRQCTHLESDIAVANARIEQDRTREKTSTDSKELTSLENEIASLTLRIEMLEDQELQVLEERDEILGTWNALKIARDSFHESRAARHDAIRADIDASRRRQADIVTARAAIVVELPADFIELYERQRARYGVGASHLHRGVTSASSVTLTAGQIQDVRAADPDEVLMCPDSNAILIRTAESGL
jgi:predicted  nucleic acid-binding Zn-ribbon protein